MWISDFRTRADEPGPDALSFVGGLRGGALIDRVSDPTKFTRLGETDRALLVSLLLETPTAVVAYETERPRSSIGTSFGRAASSATVNEAWNLRSKNGVFT